MDTVIQWVVTREIDGRLKDFKLNGDIQIGAKPKGFEAHSRWLSVSDTTG
jgi:hypothetical protein